MLGTEESRRREYLGAAMLATRNFLPLVDKILPRVLAQAQLFRPNWKDLFWSGFVGMKIYLYFFFPWRTAGLQKTTFTVKTSGKMGQKFQDKRQRQAMEAWVGAAGRFLRLKTMSMLVRGFHLSKVRRWRVRVFWKKNGGEGINIEIPDWRKKDWWKARINTSINVDEKE